MSNVKKDRKRILSRNWMFSLMIIGLSIFIMITFILPATARNSDYFIFWWTVDSGGGTVIDGDYTLSGTIGQSDSSHPMVTGNYTLTGGFWGRPVKLVDRNDIYLPLIQK